MIFSDPAFNAIYILSFIISIFSLPKVFVMGTYGDFRINKVRWKDLIVSIVLSCIPILNLIAAIIGILFWIIWIIKETPFMDTIHKILNEEVF